MFGVVWSVLLGVSEWDCDWGIVDLMLAISLSLFLAC